MTVGEMRAFIEGKSDDLLVKIDMVPNFQVSLVEAPKEEAKVEEKPVEPAA